MIPKALDAVDLLDLLSLQANEVAEGKTLEYKLELPTDTPEGRRKLLREICSFANTGGGDILFGVDARDGIPVGFPGLKSPNEDATKLRLENSCRDGIEPRLPHLSFRFVPVDDGASVLIVRVAKSWNAPHRLPQDGHFYARNSAGCYQLDVGEIRESFTLSETVAERLRRFRAERLGQIGGNDCPVRMDEAAAKMILHVMPLASFAGHMRIDVDREMDKLRRLIPLGASGWNDKPNLDGLVTYTGRGDEHGHSRAYVQMYRSGIIESVEQFTIHEGMRVVHASFEGDLLTALPGYLAVLEQLEVDYPIYLGLSFTGVTGYTFSAGGRYWGHRQIVADRDAMILPEALVDSRQTNLQAAVTDLASMVWNAFGMIRPKDFNPN
jgi:hypothetical protein